MIVGALGLTGGYEPPPAALDRLREVGAAQVPPVVYGMRYVPSVAGSYWVITQDWGPDDPRRAAIQQGEMDPAYANDIVATLPGDCSPAEAGAFVERYFKRSDDPKKDAIRAVEEAVRREQAQQEANLNAAILESNERAMRMTDHERRLLVGADTAHPMVGGADLTPAADDKPKNKRGRSSETE